MGYCLKTYFYQNLVTMLARRVAENTVTLVATLASQVLADGVVKTIIKEEARKEPNKAVYTEGLVACYWAGTVTILYTRH